MCRFCENLKDTALADDESSDDEVATAILRECTPQVVICAHNGLKFDFPFMCSQCIRHGIDINLLAQWIYADSLEVFRAFDSHMHGGCVKLGCLLQSLAPGAQFHAHRALDDCRALKHVIESLAVSLGVSPRALLHPFAVERDAVTTAYHIGMLAKYRYGTFP